MPADLLPPQYALVAYIRSPLGDFVENLRGELHPKHAHLPAHLSVLPPRPLRGTEAQALKALSEVCASIAPFEVEMGAIETFLPTTPTVFIRVSRAAYRLLELHNLLNCNGLTYEEPLPYMPHLTIAKVVEVERAHEVYAISRDRWAEYRGTRAVCVQHLTFVRGRDHSWTDIACVSLSGH